MSVNFPHQKLVIWGWTGIALSEDAGRPACGLCLGWRLMTGHTRTFADLQLLLAVAATFSFLTICFGRSGYQTAMESLSPAG